jgi:hypothetical protein
MKAAGHTQTNAHIIHIENCAGFISVWPCREALVAAADALLLAVP